MNKIALTFGAIVLCLALYSAYFITIQLPSLAQTRTVQALNHIGFKNVTIEYSDIRIKAARFENIRLDKEGLSTIKRLELIYSPLALLRHKPPTSIIITDISLIGELSNNAQISISGWHKDRLQNITPQNAPQIFSIEGGRLALLTERLGGISLDFDLQARKKNNQINLAGRLRTQQKHISAIANITGFINENSVMQIDAEIERGKLDIAPIKATRVNGQARLITAPNAPPQISGQFQAGGLNLYNMPWQNAAGSFDGDLQHYIFSADMKSLGYDGLELGLTLQRQNQKLSVSGNLYAENFDRALAYLEQFSNANIDSSPLKPLIKETDINIEFNNSPAPGTYLFVIKDKSDTALKNGEFLIQNHKIESIK